METAKEIADIPAKTLPDCPVETTLTLISDKWKVLILRDLLPGTKRFREKEIPRACVSKSSDCTASPDGRKWSGYPYCFPGSTSSCRIHTDRAWLQSQAHFGCHVGLGRELQSEKLTITSIRLKN